MVSVRPDWNTPGSHCGCCTAPLCQSLSVCIDIHRYIDLILDIFVWFSWKYKYMNKVSIYLSGVKQWTAAGGHIIVRLRPFVCVSEKLVSDELVRQDTRGVQMCADEERRRRAARVDLSHYNQALVTHTHAHRHERHPLMPMPKAESSGLRSPTACTRVEIQN